MRIADTVIASLLVGCAGVWRSIGDSAGES
jgi:hypothetical protein